jgi:DNA-binding CsgD family transcriptional regulator
VLVTDFDHGRACHNCGALDLDRRLRQSGVTPREAEVLELLASRLTNAEIAEALFISVRTVESHVSALLRKLSLPDRLSLSGLARDIVGRHGKKLPLPGVLADAFAGAPFVGRTRELERLTDLFGAVTARGRRRLALLTGEAGIGKTRLAA